MTAKVASIREGLITTLDHERDAIAGLQRTMARIKESGASVSGAAWVVLDTKGRVWSAWSYDVEFPERTGANLAQASGALMKDAFSGGG